MTAVAADAPGGAKGTPAVPAVELRRIPLAELHESPHNPRQQYDQAALLELAASLLQTGQLTPIIVRPRKGGGYEIAAGHRRFRATKLAVERQPHGAKYRGLDALEAKVVALDDRAFIEVLNIENLQRDDLHPMEEAQGFRDLMTEAGYDVAKIAARIGRSTRYVYDSLTLLKLTPKARKLFLGGAFERGHAIELARLTPDWQERALETEDVDSWHREGLFQAEDPAIDPKAPEQERLKLEEAVKPVSVREFKKWVDDKVRFKPAETDPVLFPETATQLRAAVQEKEKVIEITYDYQVPDEAKDPELVGDKAPKVHTTRAWRSATKGRPSPDTFQYGGKSPGEGKPCEHSVLGVIVIGDGRGDAFQVCVAKEKCKVHWSDWQRERKQRQKQVGPSTRSRDSYAEQQERWRREEEKGDAEDARWKKAQPAIIKAVAEKIAKLPAGPGSELAQIIVDHCMDGGKPNTMVPRGRTLEDLIRHAVFQLYLDDVGDVTSRYRRAAGLKTIKSLGINAEKIVDQIAPKPKPEKTAKKPAKKGKS